MKPIIVLALVICGASITAPEAGILRGNDLYEWCSSWAEFKERCIGYVVGVHDVFTADEKRTCIPDNVTPRQLADVVTRYLEEHPTDHHKPAPTLVLLAFVKAWCS